MRARVKILFAGLLGISLLSAEISSAATPADKPMKTQKSKTQAELARDLSATNSVDVITDAMSELERRYDRDPSLTNDIPELAKLLPDDRSPVRRKAARVLAIFHAPLSDAEIKQICVQLQSSDWGEVQSGLKAFRDLGMKQPVADILPLLKHPNPSVVRDACRTLAVIADKRVISSIEPLLNDPDKSVVKDARTAIDCLQAKP